MQQGRTFVVLEPSLAGLVSRGLGSLNRLIHIVGGGGMQFRQDASIVRVFSGVKRPCGIAQATTKKLFRCSAIAILMWSLKPRGCTKSAGR
jgi:hypothetical protein